MTWWRRLPSSLRRIALWSAGGCAVLVPAVYALQAVGDAVPAAPSWAPTGALTILVAAAGAAAALIGVWRSQWQAITQEQRSEMDKLREKSVRLEMRIDALERQLQEERTRFLEAELRHSREVGEARSEARRLEGRIQMLEPLEARVRILKEDKELLEAQNRELAARLEARGTAG